MLCNIFYVTGIGDASHLSLMKENVSEMIQIGRFEVFTAVTVKTSNLPDPDLLR
jgi:hypothetical protein